MSEKLEELIKKPTQADKPGAPEQVRKDLHDLAGLLSKTELESFAAELLNTLSQQAFGTLAKREIDLLIFHQLSQARKCKSLSTYEWANLLRISEGRVRTLRADAALRFEEADNQAALVKIAKKFHDPKKTSVEYSKGHERVKMLLDDPVLQREFEYAIRQLGRIPDYTFNRNVLDVPVTTFVAVFLKNFPDYEDKFADAFKKVVEKDEDLESFLDETKSVGERFEAAWKKHSAKRSALTGVVKGIAAAVVAA